MTSPESPPTSDPGRFVKPVAKDMLNIVQWTKSQFDACKNARSGTERQWKINLAFYYGRQNVVFRQPANFVPGQSGNLYQPPAPYYRSRPVINLLRPIVRGELSRMTSQKPSASIIPASTEDIDMYAARAGEQMWESIYRRKNLKFTLRQTLFWTLVCGSGFMKIYWDPELIDKDSDQMGDFCFDSETPFHVLVPDLRQHELEKQPYVIHAQVRTKDSVMMKYPGIKMSTTGGRDEILEDSYINLIGSGNVDDKNTVLMLEVWVKPNAIPIFPEGAMFTMVGDTIVQGVEGWPYQHKRYPFAKYDHIPSGKFYADSSLVDLIPLQREYNRTRGQIIEAKNRMAKPQLVAPAGSVDPRKITSEPGIVIEYTPGFDPPTPIPLSGLPAYVLQELDRIRVDMQDISGQHEVSRGQTPPGVTAATAISYLQEQDESMLSSSYDSLEEGMENVAFQTLSLVSQFWTTKRMIKVVGTDGSFEVMSFKGSDLRGNDDIRVEAGSALPTSKAAKQAFIMDLMKMNFIPPDKGLEVMEIGGITKIYDEIQVDVREAQRENIKMSRVLPEQIEQFNQLQLQLMQMEQSTPGEPGGGQISGLNPQGIPQLPLIIPVNDWNEHKVHIAIHNKWRKSQNFDDAPEHVKQLFDDHVKQHVDQVIMGQLAQVPPAVTDQMQEQGVDPATASALQEHQYNIEMAQKESQPPAMQEGGQPGASANSQSSS